tara:strand:- start:530 stop:817 length:288 start_codon:yes stop_codon:yes gene_type:complete
MSNTRKSNNIIWCLMVGSLVSVIFCGLFLGCAGNQILRGIDNDKSNKIQSVAEIQFEKMPWDKTETGPAVGILYGLWAFTILGCCIFLWKDKKVK